MGKILLLCCILFQLLIPVHLSASEITKETTPLLPTASRTTVSENLYILEDKERKWTIDDVRSERLANEFEKNNVSIPNFGYTTSAYWTYFEVENMTEFTEQLLEIPYPPLYEIDIYTFNRNGERIDELHIGSKYPFKDRPFHHPDFATIFTIEKNESLHFYIRFETEGSMQLPIVLWEQSGFMVEKQQRFLYLGIFYGITIVMALYNLFIFFSLRHMSYLYYVLVISSTSMVSLCLHGIGFQYLWPDSPWWNMRSIVFFMSVASIFSLLFTNNFLDIKRTLPQWRKYLIALIIINVCNAILLFFSYYLALNFLVFTVTSMIIYILLAASFALKKGVRQARFFIIAWSVFLFGSLISMLADAAFIPLTSFTKNIWQISVALEVILLSLALADRINILRQEKNEAVLASHVSQKRAIENLRRSDQLKDEFLAITSHELRTPLNGIIGIAETLKDGAAGPVSKGVAAHLSLITLSGKRLSNLINDILDFSKLKNKELNLNLTPVNVKEVTDVVLMVCAPLIKEKNIKINNSVDQSLSLVLADENRLQQILYNLIGNAIKFTDEGKIIISAKEENEKVTIHISDTGRGIPQHELETIFDHFHQIESGKTSDIAGTGIGLSITKQLVELHGGEMFVHSEVNIGSTFHFSLVKSTNEKLAETEVASATLPVPSEEISLIESPIEHISTVEKPTILIADDEVVNLQVLFNQLTLDGYHVITANSGAEALQKVKENEIDIVILDIMMPNMSGYEVCQRLRKQYSLMQLPILMLTAKNQLQDKLTSFEIGANDYLTKPCEKKELLSRVKTLVQLSHLHKQLLQFNQLLEDKVTERTVELQKANENLMDVAKSRQHLLANITHELGTPVTLLHGYVQAIQGGLIHADEENYVNLVFDKVTLLTRLIQDLADLSQLEAGQLSFVKKSISLKEWILKMNSVYKVEVTEANRKYSFMYSRNEILPTYKCDVDMERMNQVFSNLIWNAIKHTSEDTGKITISISLAQSEVTFKVQDNGVGIPEEEVPFIFERFYKGSDRMKNQTISSTGLGLTIVKEIVQAHDGLISVESELDRGSVFFVTLPIQKEL